MDKTNYVTGQIPTPDDMNAQHLLTELALDRLIAAITGGLETVLLTNRPPTVTPVGPNWQISVPEQYAAVDGRFFKAGPATLNTVVADKRVGVFFILKETDVDQFRYRLRDTGSTIVRESFITPVRKDESSRVEITESGGPTIDPPAPTLGVGDVGYVLLATITLVGSTSNIAHNTAVLWNFPGGGLSVGLHGPTHLPSGPDPVPTATPSAAGLMPANTLGVLLAALQDLSISPLSPYLERITTGDNVSTLKLSELRLRHHLSLEVKDVGGVKQLGVRFGSGPYAGQAGIAAQFDHKHSLSESPVTVVRAKVSISSLSQLGTMIEIPPFAEISEIASVRLMWAPPTFTKPNPGVECGWTRDPQTGGFIGVRAHQISGSEIRLEIGSVGLTVLQESLQELITTEFTSGVVWDSATGNGNTPRTGEIFIKIVGARA